MSEIKANDQLLPRGGEELIGLKLLVTDLDLQQTEHRGIAAYSKALLRALKTSGAEVWLLTDIHTHPRHLKRLPKAVQNLVQTTDILHHLANGKDITLEQEQLTLNRPQLGITRRLLTYVRLILLNTKAAARRLHVTIWPQRIYSRRNTKSFTLAQGESPYTQLERMSYVAWLSGIVSAKGLYASSNRLASLRTPKGVDIRLGEEFDAVITTCPLNLHSKQKLPIIQTVHDIIPLEYASHPDHASAALFSQRLASCGRAHKLFVSEDTRKKYELIYSDARGLGASTVVQPPSLCIGPEFECFAQEKRKLVIPNTKLTKSTELDSFCYLLFNSSVEPRKNLRFLLKAFSISGLSQRGIKLCIAGKLKQDSHSLSVASECGDSVILTDHIDEATKADLFLNALCILSPSLVEGFGIPVLDAACLGAQAIASTTEPHKEIQGLYDFSDYVATHEMQKTTIWASAMQTCAIREQRRISSFDEERTRRIQRYLERSAVISETFRQAVIKPIHQVARPRI
jgi:glycosyltransferase involved in cell wall biosynthesis